MLRPCTQQVNRTRCSLLLFIFIVLTTDARAFQQYELTISVLAPASTHRDARLFIAGNLSEFGDWRPDSIELTRVSDRQWSRKFRIPAGTRVEFKITRGAWSSQAVYQKGAIPPNSVVVAGSDSTIVLQPVDWSDSSAPASGGITGTVKYHRHLSGEGLNYARDLIVWLPPSYEMNREKRYPVLYMHDGQNVFDPHTSFLGYDWHVDEVADSLIRRGELKEIIIVGINNSPDRMQEYSDTKLGRAYGAFVIQRVKPLIDSAYRTLGDSKNTAVMGSSMGGLISFLFVWEYPDFFSQAACLSSVFDPPMTHVLETVDRYEGPNKRIRVYMDCGGIGGEERLQAGMREIVKKLSTRGYRESIDFVTHVDDNAPHNEYAWAARVWRPLMFLFPKTKTSKQ